MRALASALFPDAVVLKHDESVYHVRTGDGAFEFKWVDSGAGRFWNAYLFVDGSDRWQVGVIDAARGGDGRVRFEMCYDRTIVRTDDIKRALRRYGRGTGVRVSPGCGGGVGQQGDLTLAVLHDALKTAVGRRANAGCWRRRWRWRWPWPWRWHWRRQRASRPR